MVTVMLSFADKPYFKHYKQNGSLDNLTFSHIVAFVWLGLIFLGSLVVVAHPLPWLVGLLTLRHTKLTAFVRNPCTRCLWHSTPIDRINAKPWAQYP